MCIVLLHGLWTPNEAFFSSKSGTFGLGQTISANYFFGIWGRGPFKYYVFMFFTFLDPPTFLMIYSTENHQKLPHSDPTYPPLWWRNTWTPPRYSWPIYQHPFWYCDPFFPLTIISTKYWAFISKPKTFIWDWDLNLNLRCKELGILTFCIHSPCAATTKKQDNLLVLFLMRLHLKFIPYFFSI